jgi:hypothetical protein
MKSIQMNVMCKKFTQICDCKKINFHLLKIVDFSNFLIEAVNHFQEVGEVREAWDVRLLDKLELGMLAGQCWILSFTL